MNKKGLLSSQKIHERRFVFLSLLPILTLYIIFQIIPIFAGTWLMFFDYTPLNASSNFIGLDNFVKLFQNEIFREALLNTTIFVLVAIPLNIIFTLFLAVCINKVRHRGLKNTFRTFFFLPCIAPLAGSAIVWASIFNPQAGLLNMILNKLGFEGINWLTDPKVALISIIIMTLWADIGYNLIIFMAGLDAIPSSFYEAAELDGVGKWGAFRYITLPLLSRTSLFVFIMTTIAYFQMFDQFQIMTSGGPMNSTRVLSLEIYDQAFTYANMGYASAMAFVLLIIILVITVIQLRVGRTNWEY
ncbi:carbohydrate ABC transporter permease [Lederbergia panacisoli]|uniref:carbohydrate ABC transporter permease n=1 Tax=Lederbergia panacisoli TaxID=1255251 RepID=UPI00214B5070|nr:sugar ABC transporter permease [Lederbergia panacisoli]MCR2822981.1 sugar ABC transporter permease [Lederbergia panacisoli]